MPRNERLTKRRRAKPKDPNYKPRIKDGMPTKASALTDTNRENVACNTAPIRNTNGTRNYNFVLPPKYREARVVLVDLKYGNVLTQQQRRELAPRRRRTASTASDRTKDFLKKVIKEEAEWMNDWTSSSTDSFLAPRYQRQGALKQTKSRSAAKKKGGKTRSPRKYIRRNHHSTVLKVSEENIKNENSVEKTASKQRGRPKKKVTDNDVRQVEIKKENSSEVSEQQTMEYDEKSLHNYESNQDAKKTKCRTKKKIMSARLNSVFQSYSQNGAPCSDKMVFNYCQRSYNKDESRRRKQKSNVFSHGGESNIMDNIKLDEATSIKLENPTRRSIISIAYENAIGTYASHENKFSSEVNGDVRSEDFNNLQPFLQPLEKKHCSLDSIERAIEHDLATGNHLLPFGECNITDDAICLPTDIGILPDMLNLDRGISTFPGCHEAQGGTQREDCDESANSIFNAQSTSLRSSSSSTSLTSGKRKLPGIIKDDLLPRGTIDIPSIRSKTPLSERKRQKIDENPCDSPTKETTNNRSIKSWKKLPNFIDKSRDGNTSKVTKNREIKTSAGVNCHLKTSEIISTSSNGNVEGKLQNSADKSSDDKLSGAVKTWTSLPEIADLLGVKTRRINEEPPIVGWYDSLNNNQHGPVNNKNESNYHLYSSLPLTSPNDSTISDEYKAMSDLLSTLDNSQTIDNTVDKSGSDINKNHERTNAVLCSPLDKAKHMAKPVRTEKTDNAGVKTIEKLTMENFDEFNTVSQPSISSRIGYREGRIEAGSSSINPRKRKWVTTEEVAKPSERKTNGKIKLVRKHWNNENNWALEKCDNSSTARVTNPPSVSESVESRKVNEDSMKRPPTEQIRISVPIKKDNMINDSSFVEEKAVSINNNFPEPSSFNEIAKKSEEVDQVLPGFGESSIYNVGNEETSKSLKSSNLSSSSTSSFSSSDGSSSDDSRDNESISHTSIDDTLENNDEIEDLEHDNDLRAENREGSENRVDSASVEASISTEKIKTKIRASQIEEPRIESLRRNIDSEETMTNTVSDRETMIVRYNLDVNTVERVIGIDHVDHELHTTAVKPKIKKNLEKFFDEIEAAPHAKELSSDMDELKGGNCAGTLNDGEEKGSDDDEGDCISLFTESLCMSRCGSPSLFELPKRRRSPNVQEPYTRMKSANIGKFVTENNRECEEIFQAYENTAIKPDNIFERQSILEPLFLEPIGTKSTDRTYVLPDLRSTLMNRINNRDVSSLFRGQCYSWLRIGKCNNMKTCRFKHCLKPILLQVINHPDEKILEPLLTYAINNTYSHFLELARTKVLCNMNGQQITSLFGQLYRARQLTISYIESIFKALEARGLPAVTILSVFLEIVNQEDAETLRCISLALYQTLEAGTCWDVLGQLATKIVPPTEVVEKIIQEAINKNCQTHATKVYELMIKQLPYHKAYDIRSELWSRFNSLKTGKNLNVNIPPIQYPVQTTVPATASRGISSPDSPRAEYHDQDIQPIVEPRKSSISDISSPLKITQPSFSQAKRSQTRSPPLDADASYNLHPLDKIPSPKCPYRDNLWKFHWDLQGVQEGLKHRDYAHVISILSQYAKYPNRLPHIQGFYSILCKEITSAKHHMIEIVRLTVQFGSTYALRLYVYDLGICVLTKLADIGAWLHAYELLKTFELYGPHNTCAFTLLAAEVYIANRRPSKALDLLEKSRIVCTNTKRWRQIQCRSDEQLRLTVMDLLLHSLCDGHAEDAFRLLDFILRDQCSTYKPINLLPHVDRIARLVLSEKRTNLIIDIGRLIIQAKLIVSTTTFRNIINHVFHDDRVLAKQLHRYATWLGVYNRAKINGSSCAHMIINTEWTEEETFLMITSLIDDLYVNIGHAIDRLKPRQLNVFLIFEVLPTERQLAMDICSGVLSAAAMNKRRDTVKNVLNRFDPKIKIVQRSQGRVCKLQSQSLVDYLKSGQISL